MHANQEYTQFYLDTGYLTKFKINHLDISNSTLTPQKLNNTLTSWQSLFNPDENYLFQIGVVDCYSEKSSRIYFALHHLLIDVVSWRIICHDLELIYTHLCSITPEQAKATDVAEILGTKGTSYRQWVYLINNYANSEDHKQVEIERAY